MYGSGFGKKDRDPKVQLAGVDVGYFIVESSDTRLVIALDPNSTAVQDLFQAIPGPTSDQADFAPYSSFHLQLLIKPRGRKQTACAPITISAGYPASTGEIPETSTEPVGATLLRSYVGAYAPVISLR